MKANCRNKLKNVGAVETLNLSSAYIGQYYILSSSCTWLNCLDVLVAFSDLWFN